MDIIIPVHPLFLTSLPLKDILLFITSKRFSYNQNRLGILPTELITSVFAPLAGEESFSSPPFNEDIASFTTSPPAYIDLSSQPCSSLEELQSDIDYCVSEAIETVKAYFVKTAPFPLSEEEKQLAEDIVNSIQQDLRSEYQKILSKRNISIERVNVIPFRLTAQNTPQPFKELLISKVIPLVLSSFPFVQTIPVCNPYTSEVIFVPVIPAGSIRESGGV